MHKGIYASGFLYHPASRQILLQQFNSSTDKLFPWTLFEEKCLDEKSAKKTFQKLIFKLLGIKIKAVHPVYSYPHKFVVYAEIEKQKNFSPRDGKTFAWFDFRRISKLNLEEQVEHDIIIGQRVVDSALRKSLGEQTLE